MIVEALVKLVIIRSRGLKSLVMSCKGMQRMVDTHVTKIRQPQELWPCAHAGLRRWPHAVEAHRVGTMEQAAVMLAFRPHLAQLALDTEPPVRIDLAILVAFPQLLHLDLGTEIEDGDDEDGDLQLPELNLAALPQLHTLKIINRRITNPGILSTLVGLQQLKLDGCMGMGDMSPPSTLTRLESLSLEISYHVELDLRPISVLTQLESLSLGCNPDLETLHIGALPGLRNLEVSWCSRLASIGSLSMLTGLSSLGMRYCRAVTSLEPLSTLTGLSSLNMEECWAVTSLEPLSTLTGLGSLNMQSCIAMASLAGLSTLTALISLNMLHCSAVTSLEPLSTLTGLRQLWKYGCDAAGALPPLMSPMLHHDDLHGLGF